MRKITSLPASEKLQNIAVVGTPSISDFEKLLFHVGVCMKNVQYNIDLMHS